MNQKAVISADKGWIEKDIREFPGSPAARIGDGWMLITAGNLKEGKDNWNTMTASWGGLGVLWGRNVAFMFIRPVRYTFDFANTASLFSLSFFNTTHRKALEFCGSRTGRDTDKAAGTGLTPLVFEEGKAAGGIGFKEASEVIVCRKLYTHDFDPAVFLDPAIETNYPEKDYHRMFIGEVLALEVNQGV
ncbi:MAG: flavin reductase family protein [Spirochaetaceae bacterium]|jgi:flavin reductase (DIM6/NTAB) family NADH-FMN oxidoreductase RutF|nr:flavin reductase family protein [Spirochaetaceae bacterium]